MDIENFIKKYMSIDNLTQTYGKINNPTVGLVGKEFDSFIRNYESIIV